MNEQVRLMTDTEVTDTNQNRLRCPKCNYRDLYYDRYMREYRCLKCGYKFKHC